MMDTLALALLKGAFPQSNPVLSFCLDLSGSFGLSDLKTCSHTIPIKYCNPFCDQVILNFYSTNSLTCIKFDDWLSSSFGERCDWLVFDSGCQKNCFAFCELTCSEKEYIDKFVNSTGQEKPGKRAKAYSQIKSAWDNILSCHNPMFSLFVLNFRKRIGIFGWRNPSMNQTQDKASANMQKFGQTPTSGAKILKVDGLSFGENFDFYQVNYPNIFNWDLI